MGLIVEFLNDDGDRQSDAVGSTISHCAFQSVEMPLGAFFGTIDKHHTVLNVHQNSCETKAGFSRFLWPVAAAL